MIPATVPYTAAFVDDDGIRTTVPVVAWSAEGDALVATKLGKLIPAAALVDFREVYPDVHRLAAAVPGAGVAVTSCSRCDGAVATTCPPEDGTGPGARTAVVRPLVAPDRRVRRRGSRGTGRGRAGRHGAPGAGDAG